MEHGRLSREAFMAEIAAMTERIVRGQEYDRDTVGRLHAALKAPCPTCGGIVRENYRRYTCTRRSGRGRGCGFSFGKSPAGRTFEVAEVERCCATGASARCRASAQGQLAVHGRADHQGADEETRNHKLEFDFGDDKSDEETGELVDFSGQVPGALRNAAARCMPRSQLPCAPARCQQPSSPRAATSARAR